jgi:hypothetical protein
VSKVSKLPLCEIVIPSLGRLDALRTLLNSISAQVDEIDTGKLTILLSFNLVEKSEILDIERALKVDVAFKNLNMRLITSNHYLDSADESTLFAIEASDAEFVWLMGDDDVLLPGALKKIFEILLSKEVSRDFYYLNSRWASPLGGTYQGTALNMSLTDRADLTFGEFVLKAGFNYGPGGLSRIIVRRAALNLDIWKKSIVLVSPVWSTVTAFSASFWNSQIYIVSEPLISYRLNDYHLGRSNSWFRLAKRNRYLSHEIWTTNLMGHIEFLEANGVFRSRIFNSSTVSEFMIYKTFENEILSHLHEQFKLALHKKTERFSHPQLKLISDFLVKVWPQNFVLAQSIDELSNDINNKSKLRLVLTILRNTLTFASTEGHFNNLKLGILGEYEVFLSSNKFLGVHKTIQKDKALTILFPGDYQPVLIYSDSLQDLKSRIDSSRTTYSKVDFEISLASLYNLLEIHGVRVDTILPPVQTKVFSFFDELIIKLRHVAPPLMKRLIKKLINP